MSTRVDYKGFACRPGTLDKYIVDELRGYKAIPLRPADSVLDIGGCIGTFARLALEAGCAKVVTVEPMPDNFALLKVNAKEATAINAAVVLGDEKVVSFYVNRGINKGMHSTVPTRGRDIIEVPAVKYKDLLLKHKPTVIKMDCEGAEFELLQEPFPAGVRALFLEIHLQKKQHRAGALELHNKILEQGFKAVKEPKLGNKAWATLACYERDASLL